MTVDELREYGMAQMDDEEIRSFLSSQGVGVLGLPTAGTPYMLPMSFGFDGESDLYFTYVLGASSRKADLSDRAERAGFLVYKADTMFNWESVLLTGTLEAVPEEEWGEVQDVLGRAWRPDLLKQASATEATAVYRFHVEEQEGIKHTGLPPGFEVDQSEGHTD